MTDQGTELDSTDVVIIGGDPSGCTAAVFTARYGLDTVVLGRRNVALHQCAYFENCLGFPAGIGVGTFTMFMHKHLAEAGADYIADVVVSIKRSGDESEVATTNEDESGAPDTDARRFVVRAREGCRVEVDHVVAAAWYDGGCLRDLGDDNAVFEEHDHHGKAHKQLDSDYADDGRRTPVDELYIAAPSDDRNAQVGIAVEQGGHVVQCLIEDRRCECSFSGDLMAHYDWFRVNTRFRGEWGDHDHWHKRFDGEVLDSADLDDGHLAELHESYIDRAFNIRRADHGVEAAELRGIRRLVGTIGTECVLDVLPDEALADYLDERKLGGVEQ